MANVSFFVSLWVPNTALSRPSCLRWRGANERNPGQKAFEGMTTPTKLLQTKKDEPQKDWRREGLHPQGFLEEGITLPTRFLKGGNKLTQNLEGNCACVNSPKTRAWDSYGIYFSICLLVISLPLSLLLSVSSLLLSVPSFPHTSRYFVLLLSRFTALPFSVSLCSLSPESYKSV